MKPTAIGLIFMGILSIAYCAVLADGSTEGPGPIIGIVAGSVAVIAGIATWIYGGRGYLVTRKTLAR